MAISHPILGSVENDDIFAFIKGKRICAWCHKELPKRRQSWCSDECLREYRITTDWGYTRSEVWKRDKGICRMCGINLDDLAGAIQWFMRWCQKHPDHGRRSEYLHFRKALGSVHRNGLTISGKQTTSFLEALGEQMNLATSGPCALCLPCCRDSAAAQIEEQVRCS